MRVGVFTPLLSQFPLDDVLKKLKAHKIDTVELGTGNYPGDAHCKLSMLEDRAALGTFKTDAGRPGLLHQRAELPRQSLAPGSDRARHDQEVSRKTIRLAEKLGVPVVVDFSGCPGDSPDAKRPELGDLPVAAGISRNCSSGNGRKSSSPIGSRKRNSRPIMASKSPSRCIRASSSTIPRRMLKLREIAGPAIGCNYDPSHMFWQGIDPIAAIRLLGDAIFHVHAKDTQIYDRNLPLTGVLDTKPYTDERHRAWIFRTCGYGHGEEWWREFVSTLRMFGYDYVLSIEHEDSLLSAEEGLSRAAAFLHQIVPREQPGRCVVGLS